MTAHFYDTFAVRKFVPTIPFLRPVLVTLLSMTITINNSNYKLTTSKKWFIEHHRVALLADNGNECTQKLTVHDMWKFNEPTLVSDGSLK